MQSKSKIIFCLLLKWVDNYDGKRVEELNQSRGRFETCPYTSIIKKKALPKAAQLKRLIQFIKHAQK